MPARSWRTSDWGEEPWMVSSVEYSTSGSVWNPPEHAERPRTQAMHEIWSQQALGFFVCSAGALVRARILASPLPSGANVYRHLHHLAIENRKCRQGL